MGVTADGRLPGQLRAGAEGTGFVSRTCGLAGAAQAAQEPLHHTVALHCPRAEGLVGTSGEQNVASDGKSCCEQSEKFPQAACSHNPAWPLCRARHRF